MDAFIDSIVDALFKHHPFQTDGEMAIFLGFMVLLLTFFAIGMIARFLK